MHDAKGRPLKKGDIALIPVVVNDTYASEEYCNVSLETLYGRRPDGNKEKFSAINTGQILRANAGDTNDFSEFHADPLGNNTGS